MANLPKDHFPDFMIKNKKIMFICPYFPPHTGGLEKYVYNIAEGLQKKFNWKAVVITTDRNQKQVGKIIQDGIKVYRLPVFFTLSNTPINPLWYFYLKQIIKEEQPDLINAHAPVPFLPDLAALISNKNKFILTYHDGTMMKKKSIFNIPIYIYEHFFLRYTLEKAKFIICSSDFIRKSFLQKYIEKSISINPGVESIGKPEKKKAHKKIVFIASLTKAQKHKGLDLLLHAIPEVKKSVKDVQLTVVGHGDAVQTYKSLAIKLKLGENVVFSGALFGENLKEVLRQSDVLVLPTSKESFGMVLIEAMAQGTPVIATKVGGIPDIISDGHDGFLIPPGDINEISKAIIKILKDARLAKIMGENGQKKVKENYLWEKQVTATNAIFEKALN
jgi:glycosyltransferase involved in cell wall biosynthesis